MLFHLPVTPERPKLTEIRPKLVLKGSRFHRRESVGQKAKTGLEARDKVSIRLKTDEHVVHVLSLKASRRMEALIISSRGLGILAPLYLYFREGRTHGGKGRKGSLIIQPNKSQKNK